MSHTMTVHRHTPAWTTPAPVTIVECATEREALHARAVHAGVLLRNGYAMQGVINLGERLVFTKTCANAPTRVYSIIITQDAE